MKERMRRVDQVEIMMHSQRIKSAIRTREEVRSRM